MSTGKLSGTVGGSHLLSLTQFFRRAPRVRAQAREGVLRLDDTRHEPSKSLL